MSSKRRRFSGELEVKVALEALRGDRTRHNGAGTTTCVLPLIALPARPQIPLPPRRLRPTHGILPTGT